MAEDIKRFDTGAVRSNDAEATRYDLISPIALEVVAATYAEGAAKYSDHNWLKGMPVHDLLNHVIRHIYKFLSGDRSEPHLGHAAWGVLAAIHSHEMWPHLNEGHLCGPGCTPPGEVKGNASKNEPEQQGPEASERLSGDSGVQRDEPKSGLPRYRRSAFGVTN